MSICSSVCLVMPGSPLAMPALILQPALDLSPSHAPHDKVMPIFQKPVSIYSTRISITSSRLHPTSSLQTHLRSPHKHLHRLLQPRSTQPHGTSLKQLASNTLCLGVVLANIRINPLLIGILCRRRGSRSFGVNAPRNGAVAEQTGRECYLEEEGGAGGADIEDVSGRKNVRKGV